MDQKSYERFVFLAKHESVVTGEPSEASHHIFVAIKDHARAQRITLEVLCERAGVNKGSYYTTRSRRGFLSYEQLTALQRQLDVLVEELMPPGYFTMYPDAVVPPKRSLQVILPTPSTTRRKAHDLIDQLEEHDLAVVIATAQAVVYSSLETKKKA